MNGLTIEPNGKISIYSEEPPESLDKFLKTAIERIKEIHQIEQEKNRRLIEENQPAILKILKRIFRGKAVSRK